MTVQIRHALAAAGLLALATGGTTAHAASATVCDPAAATAAFKSGNLDRLIEINRTSKDPGSNCSEKVTYCTGRLTAIVYRDKAMAAANADASLDELNATLEKRRSLSAPWQILTALGELQMAQGKETGDKKFYDKAADNLERAVNDIYDGSSCAEFGEPKAPPPAQIGHRMREMQEAKLLAPTFKVVSSRDVECGGVFLTSVRGFEAESVPVPIEFDYNQASLTPKGRDAAAAVAKCVIAGNAKAIRLSGHTDMHGTPTYNMGLSAARLATVRAFLVAQGYKGVVDLVPKGMSEPFVGANGGGYSPTEIDQMNRRVELRDTKK